MFELPLHTGAQHPDLLWVLVPSVLSFAAGVGLGSVSSRLRDWILPRGETSTTDR